MAPRKKRVAKNVAPTSKTRSGIKYPTPGVDLKKVVPKKPIEPKKPPIIKPLEPMVTRSHKKFGKYRFFAGNDPLEQSIDINKEDTDSSVSVESGLHLIEEVMLPESALEMENENVTDTLASDDSTDPVLFRQNIVTSENYVCEENESSSQSGRLIEENESTEMESTIVIQEPEMTIAQQLSHLNVNSEEINVDSEQRSCESSETIQYVAEPEKQVSEMYHHMDNFESAVFIDCISEEVIPICGEQEIMNENDSSDSRDNNEKEVICNEDEDRGKEELAAILEDSKSENEELCVKIENTVSEVDNRESELSNPKEDEDKDMQHLAEIIGCTSFEDVSLGKVEASTSEETNKTAEDMILPEDIKKEPVKSKSKPKISKKKPEKSDKSDDSKISENSVRRSNRIKSISVLKKKSTKGHGLVKQKTEISTKNNEIEPSETNTPVLDLPNNKTTQKSVNHALAVSLPDQKPVKVKSRWRRSSELELSSTPSSNSNKIPVPTATTQQPDVNVSVLSEEEIKRRDSEEVARRLKQFVHLKENLYLTDRLSCKEAKKMVCDCFLTGEDIEQGEYGCGEDCLNRLLMIECGSLCAVGDRCTNKRFQKGQFAPCEVFCTEKKGLGIRAAANIPYGEFILEYVGEVLDPEEFEKRAAEYSKDKNQHYYFMSLRADAVIDATRKGNVSRFINHSCDPNAETQKWTVNGELRIGFFSKRTILAGEEITFDYQFQRYGKEAQKCFCEAATCRGWLGEEPDDEDDEDEDDDEDEEEEDEEEEAGRKMDDNEGVAKEIAGTSPSLGKADDQEKADEIQKAVPAIKQEKSVKKEKKRALRQRLPRKELFEDLDLDDEIETLQTTGLKNQAHTLKLSRLMVRAKEPAQRTKLLRVLRRGEFPCRRLFLDYHGLRLIHGWMTDAQHLSRINKNLESLRLEILQTLATLPIPNKTMLQDSKVLPTVEKWSVKLEEVSPIDSDSNSPQMETDTSTSEQSTLKNTLPAADNKDFIKTERDAPSMSHLCSNNPSQIDMDISPVAFEEKDSIKVKNIRPPPPPAASTLTVDDYETEIIALALKLLEEWSVLKVVFRIPKKERIEQMKEHEREADRKYKAGLGFDGGQDASFEKKDLKRYSLLWRRQKKKRRKDSRSDSFIDKYERRKIFAMQVEQREMERRRHQREFWQQHEQRCVVMGADPRFTAPFDPNQGYQCVWNPQTGQWQNYSLPGNQNFNQHHLHPPAQPPSHPMLPPMQPNQQMMKHMLPKPPPPMPFNPQQPPLPPPHPSNQFSIRPPPPAMNAPNLSHLGSSNMPMPHQQQPPPPRMTPQCGVLPYPPANLGEHMHQQPQPQQIPYHLSVEGQNPPPSAQNLLQHPSLSAAGHGKMPPPLPALPYQEALKEQEEVKFMGPIPPPAKLPPKWKCAKDKYGRPYYYHIKVRKSQWEPPELPPEENDDGSEATSSSDTSSMSSDSSTEETDSDDEIDDAKLLLQIKNKFKQMDAVKNADKSGEVKEPDSIAEDDNEGEKKERSLDDRLIEEFCFMKNSDNQAKRKRVGLVQEILISPRTEEDRLQFKEDMKRYKQNKEKLKRQKELLLEQSKKHASPKPSKSVVTPKPVKPSKKHKISVKTKLKEMGDCENAKKIKEAFRSSMAVVMVSILNIYRKPECKEGRITNTEDFKHLARKLTHFVMLKELKHCQNIEDLTCTESVKSKAREFVRKYMSKFGEVYQKPKDEAEFY